MRRWLTVGILVGVIVVGGGAIWWLFLSSFGERQWQTGQERLKAQGYRLEYGSVERSGFPFKLVWTLHDVSLSHDGDGDGSPPFRGEADGLRLTSLPWEPQRVTFRVEGRHRWTVDTKGKAGLVDIAIGAAEGTIGPQPEASGWRLDSRLRDIVAQPRANATGATGAAGATGDLHIAEATVQVDAPLRLDALTLDARLDRIDLPQDFGLGTVVETLGVKGEVRPLPHDLAAPGLQKWQAAGGRLTLTAADVRFGAVDGGANGTLGLDRQLRLSGDLDLRLRQPNRVLDLGVERGWVGDKQRTLYAMAIGLFTRQAADGEPEAAMQMAFRNGALWLGPIRIANLPPVVPLARP
ncbi:MAG: DUF2125 domain-containing protein [Alphaproteobacteria bacterium]|nr:DUF2125 domain-containing protein [Alphaproteobacteria bacterium]